MSAPFSRIITVLAVALLFIGTATACASSGESAAGDDSNEVTVRVVSGISVGNLTVFAMSSNGTRNLLGNAAANDTTVFTFRPVDTQYRLVGRQVSGEEIVSRPITVIPPQTLRWDVAMNNIVTTDGS